MSRRLMLWIAIAGLMLVALAATACQPQQQEKTGAENPGKETPGGHKELTNAQLTDVAPGLGTLMVEIGYRNWVLYYAAKGGNWELAAYQSKEIKEAAEAGTITRPARKPGLENFVDNSMKPIDDAIKAKDSSAFTSAWSSEVAACNSCHDSEKFSYIKWKLPATPPEDLELSVPAAGAPSGTTSPTP